LYSILWFISVRKQPNSNGGPVQLDGICGANNFPLRGGKASNFDGARLDPELGCK
jgi:hypothetical protein